MPVRTLLLAEGRATGSTSSGAGPGAVMRVKPPRSVRALIALLSLVFLSACLPRAASLEQPTFRPVPESFALVRLDPPGVGSGTATFSLDLEVGNPNPFALSLSELDFVLFINDRRAARGRSAEGVVLPPRGSERLTLDITAPLSEAPELLDDMARLVAGEPTRYRLEGAATVGAFRLRRRLSSVTLASGTVEQPVALRAPTFRYLPERSGLRELSVSRVVIEVGLELSNPTPLGYVFSAPDLRLMLGGRSVGEGQVVTQALPAFGSAALTLRFELSPATLGVALASRLANLSGGKLELGLSGRFALELPGILRRDFSIARLLSAVLR